MHDLEDAYTVKSMRNFYIEKNFKVQCYDTYV